MGVAYLPDGSIMDYKEYIETHPHWKKVRETRYKFDNCRCVICHRDLRGEQYQTHHLSYQMLGSERLRDVITLCDSCHRAFHQNWERARYWKGKESGHWEIYNLEKTARLCAEHWRSDRIISKNPANPNLCSYDVCRQLMDDYFRDHELTQTPKIDPGDISLFIRNKRYELYLEAERRGLTVEQFLDEYFGPKIRGKNPIRQEAGKKGGVFDHTPANIKKYYKENKNILILMEEVKKIEEEKSNE